MLEIQSQDLKVDARRDRVRINGMSARLMVSRRFCGRATNGSSVPVDVVAGPGRWC